MSEGFFIKVNGHSVAADAATSVAAVMLRANQACRNSVEGTPRTPFCGMGVCMECRATVNGRAQRRTCQLLCTPGMEVVTG
jgi:sarcosine oxidase subunit alpha